MALAVPLPAQASRLWNWSYTGAGITASGTFATHDTPDRRGYYEITGITGSRNGVAILSFQPTDQAIPGNPGFPVDNLISASGRLTSHGFGFKTADGNHANPFYADFRTPPGFLEVFTRPASTGFSELPIEFVAAIAPEDKHAGSSAQVICRAGRGRQPSARGDHRSPTIETTGAPRPSRAVTTAGLNSQCGRVPLGSSHSRLLRLNSL
jgi:hypothetical protein